MKISISLKDRLPMPTLENPYAQVNFIFEEVIRTKTNKNTKNNYISALTFYKNFLVETNNYDKRLIENPLFYLNQHWNEFAYICVDNYVKNTNIPGEKGYLTTYSITSHLSAIRRVMRNAVANRLTATNDLYLVPTAQAFRETENHEAYTEEEVESINRALAQELAFSLKVCSGEGYKKTGVGRDPRQKPEKREGKGFPEGWGWRPLDNVRWYFENVLHCVPIVATSDNKKNHKFFVESLSNLYLKDIGGLRGLYRQWGVTSLIDADVIMPLVMKLAIETGLNPQSILSLEVDCFIEEHKLSGLPYIKYFKGRSGGEKEFQIVLEHENMDIKEFRLHQSVIIRKTIEKIVELTSDIRNTAPDNLKNNLLLYQTSSNRIYGKTSLINEKVCSVWYGKLVEKYGLTDSSGQPLKFNMVRWRPTRITNLVKMGIDFFEIQHEAGHSNIRTTLNYIARNNLNYVAQEETDKALKKIFDNTNWVKKSNPTYSDISSNCNSTLIYKGIVSDCKNPFNPPDEVKRLKNYKSGDVCSRYNMCFFCSNIIIFKKHLPKIWLYKTQIELALNISKNDLPNELFYRRSLDIIDNLFDSEKSEFSKEDIEWAKEIAETMDDVIDPVVYKLVSE